MKFRFNVGERVQIGTGARIPVRYENRFGIVSDRRTKAGKPVYDVTFWPRRVTPLTVTQGQILTVVE